MDTVLFKDGMLNPPTECVHMADSLPVANSTRESKEPHMQKQSLPHACQCFTKGIESIV